MLRRNMTLCRIGVVRPAPRLKPRRGRAGAALACSPDPEDGGPPGIMLRSQ
jgi:hypothetical protein